MNAYYILTCTPGREARAVEALQSLYGVDGLCPHERRWVRCRKNGRGRQRTLRRFPVAPGYVFASTDAANVVDVVRRQRTALVRTITGYLSLSGDPHPVPLEQLLPLLSRDGSNEASHALSIDQIITVRGHDIQAQITALRSASVVVAMEMFGAVRDVEVPIEAVEVAA